MSALLVDRFVDRVYEAAVVPDRWDELLDDLASATASASSSVLVFDPAPVPPRFRAAAPTRVGIQHFVDGDLWRRNKRQPGRPETRRGFVCDADYLTPEELAQDGVAETLAMMQMGWQLGTMFQLPTGEDVIFTLERWLPDGRHPPDTVSALEALRPHLGRAGLLAARLRFERLKSMTDVLEKVGLPAAVLGRGGRVLSVNARFENLRPAVAACGGELRVLQAGPRRLLAAALNQEAGARAARSIPVRGDGVCEPAVLHVAPVRQDARDLFSDAAFILAATPVGRPTAAATDTLAGLFDLTAAEGRLLSELTGGGVLAEIAAARGVAVSTLRTQLSAVFDKTGVRSQGELVGLAQTLSKLPLG